MRDHRASRALFVLVYLLSGAAALVYEVVWARLLTLQMGSTVTAVGTVLAAFMGGMAGGALLAGRIAPRLERRQALRGYAALELLIAACALLVPLALAGLRPLLAVAYADGAGGAWFAAVRMLTSLTVLAIPAAAMGATLPLAVRWFVGPTNAPGTAAGGLYAANTLGAALGAAGAGFVLLPGLGLTGAALVAVGLNAASAAGALGLAASGGSADLPAAAAAARPGRRQQTRRARGRPGVRRCRSPQGRRHRRSFRADSPPGVDRPRRAGAVRVRRPHVRSCLDTHPRPHPRPDDLRVQHHAGDLHRRTRRRLGNRRVAGAMARTRGLLAGSHAHPRRPRRVRRTAVHRTVDARHGASDRSARRVVRRDAGPPGDAGGGAAAPDDPRTGRRLSRWRSARPRGERTRSRAMSPSSTRRTPAARSPARCWRASCWCHSSASSRRCSRPELSPPEADACCCWTRARPASRASPARAPRWPPSGSRGPCPTGIPS